MRQQILDYLGTISVSGFVLTQELPWDNQGQPLYLKNMKRIYVDQDQVAQEPLIDTLNGAGIVNQITTVSVFVATDAKTPPQNLGSLVSQISAARLDSDLVGATQRQTQVTTEFDQDRQVTRFDISFRQLIVNS
jgi:hypothetical protein